MGFFPVVYGQFIGCSGDQVIGRSETRDLEKAFARRFTSPDDLIVRARYPSFMPKMSDPASGTG